MKKFDRTSYSQRDTERCPRIWEYTSSVGDGSISYKIHRHIVNPDTWFLTCKDFCEMVDLHTNDIAEAEQKAALYMCTTVKARIKELEALVHDIETSFDIAQ